jgi:hypothetical protein
MTQVPGEDDGITDENFLDFETDQMPIRGFYGRIMSALSQGDTVFYNFIYGLSVQFKHYVVDFFHRCRYWPSQIRDGILTCGDFDRDLLENILKVYPMALGNPENLIAEHIDYPPFVDYCEKWLSGHFTSARKGHCKDSSQDPNCDALFYSEPHDELNLFIAKLYEANSKDTENPEAFKKLIELALQTEAFKTPVMSSTRSHTSKDIMAEDDASMKKYYGNRSLNTVLKYINDGHKALRSYVLRSIPGASVDDIQRNSPSDYSTPSTPSSSSESHAASSSAVALPVLRYHTPLIKSIIPSPSSQMPTLRSTLGASPRHFTSAATTARSGALSILPIQGGASPRNITPRNAAPSPVQPASPTKPQFVQSFGAAHHAVGTSQGIQPQYSAAVASTNNWHPSYSGNRDEASSSGPPPHHQRQTSSSRTSVSRSRDQEEAVLRRANSSVSTIDSPRVTEIFPHGEIKYLSYPGEDRYVIGKSVGDSKYVEGWIFRRPTRRGEAPAPLGKLRNYTVKSDGKIDFDVSEIDSLRVDLSSAQLDAWNGRHRARRNA